ncbi:MAG: hypothetical protein IJ796_04370 [Lachnospiraceae bacterium]|nr:hypothetical protein [Lachnospiraceae bacterium]
MRNPLAKRIPRNIKKDWKKYLVLCLLLIVTISLVSAMYVSNNSMERTFAESFDDYNIEDGHFEFEEKVSGFLMEKIEGEGIKVYEQFYKDFDEDKDLDGKTDATIRVFKVREEVNLICLLEGKMPETKDEIVIDRRHAGNVGITVGDTIAVGDKKMKVCGLVAFSDYSTLYKKNTDTMFDAITFNIAAVTPESFEELSADTNWQYAYRYPERPETDDEKKALSDDLISKVAVLGATGGYMDDEDEAKELADNVDIWTEYLEDIKEKADDLEARGDDLQARADALEAEGKELETQGDELTARGEELEKEGASIQSEMQSLMTRAVTALALAGVPVSQDMMGGASEGEIPAEIIAMLPADIQKSMADLKKRGDALQAEADELKAKGDELQPKADELKARGDALKEEGDALQAEADELEALKPTIDEYTDNLKKLEPYEDHINELKDFVPEYLCQAIHFAPNDMGNDKAMAEVLLIVLVVVLAFIFAITASNTITSEAKVIGTLRASGYTRGELLIHYIAVPLVLTFISAAIGNIIGYTLLRGAVVAIYGRSYSLPAIKTYWDGDAFIRTTVFHMITVIVINIATVFIRLRIAPLKFLRGDLSMRKSKKAVKLPKWSFFSRFRMRIFNQNVPGYLVLFIGVFFVMVLLVFSVGMPYTLKNYIARADDFAIADYQYILMSTKDEDDNEITTGNPDAERFSMTSLSTVSGARVGEEISVYGYSKDSRYFPLSDELEEGKAYISSDYAEKFGLKKGDTVELKEKFAKDHYFFTVEDVFEMRGSLAVLMPQDVYNKVFDEEEGYFSGYISDSEITDIDEGYIAATITSDDIIKMANQLNYSMGSIMDIFSYCCILLAVLIIYLLTKLIIEKNAGSISMVKVLGYKTGEIGRLYVLLTSIVVVISAGITALLSYFFVGWLWKMIMLRMAGWFTFEMNAASIIKCIAMVIIAYALVALIDLRRIKRIPLTEALKNVE